MRKKTSEICGTQRVWVSGFAAENGAGEWERQTHQVYFEKRANGVNVTFLSSLESRRLARGYAKAIREEDPGDSLNFRSLGARTGERKIARPEMGPSIIQWPFFPFLAGFSSSSLTVCLFFSPFLIMPVYLSTVAQFVPFFNLFRFVDRSIIVFLVSSLPFVAHSDPREYRLVMIHGRNKRWMGKSPRKSTTEKANESLTKTIKSDFFRTV